MATLNPYFDQFELENLKIKLSEKIGFTIANKPDCAKLSEIITTSKNGYLSETTIYRIFFQFGKHKFYKNTYDILCKFIGYNDSIEFLEITRANKENLNTTFFNKEKSNYNSLLFFCIENKSYKPLNNFFEAIEKETHEFKNYISIFLFDSLIFSSKTTNFFQFFANQKYIREYFFEKGHDPKFRIKNYEIGYLNYLNCSEKYKNENQLQDYIFGNCVLFRHYFLNQKSQSALNIGKKIYTEFNTLELKKSNIHIFPFIRFISYKLWYLKITKTDELLIEDYACYLLNLCKSLKTELEYIDTKFLFHTVAETFLYGYLPERYHWELKEIFADEYKKIPEIVFTKNLKYSLSYFEMNGLLYHRP
jgi:hypothetical protein